jgi:hypothetical protein
VVSGGKGRGNPRRAGLVERAGEYRWSSLGDHGEGRRDALLDGLICLGGYGGFAFAARLPVWQRDQESTTEGRHEKAGEIQKGAQRHARRRPRSLFLRPRLRVALSRAKLAVGGLAPPNSRRRAPPMCAAPDEELREVCVPDAHSGLMQTIFEASHRRVPTSARNRSGVCAKLYPRCVCAKTRNSRTHRTRCRRCIAGHKSFSRKNFLYSSSTPCRSLVVPGIIGSLDIPPFV